MAHVAFLHTALFRSSSSTFESRRGAPESEEKLDDDACSDSFRMLESENVLEHDERCDSLRVPESEKVLEQDERCGCFKALDSEEVLEDVDIAEEFLLLLLSMLSKLEDVHVLSRDGFGGTTKPLVMTQPSSATVVDGTVRIACASRSAGVDINSGGDSGLSSGLALQRSIYSSASGCRPNCVLMP